MDSPVPSEPTGEAFVRKIPTSTLSLFIIVLWGATFPAITLALRNVSPFTLAGWRVLPAGIVVSLWALLRRYPLPSRRLWGAAAVSALFNVVMLYGGQIAASAYLSPGLVAGLIYLQPMLVALLARGWLGESLSPTKLSGIGLGLLGVGLIAFSAGAHASVLGIVFAVSGAMGWAVGTVYLKAHQADSPVWFVALQFLLGGSVFAVLAILVPHTSPHWSLAVMADVFFIMVGGTAGAWLLWLLLLSRGEASRVSTFLFGVPVVASLIGILGFNETLSFRFIGGLLAVSVSILLVNAKRGRRPRSNPAVPSDKSKA